MKLLFVLFALLALHSEAAIVPVDSDDTWHDLWVPEDHETYVFKGPYLNVKEDDRNGRVIHGIPAAPGAFPYVARMSIITPVGGVLCSASLIAIQWILGASHCFHGIDVTAIQFGLGSIDRDSPDMINVFSDRWAWPPIVSGIRPDFAVFHLVSAVPPHGGNISPIRLPSQSWTGNLWVGRDVQIIGWGGALGGLPRFLQFGDFIVGEPSGCNMFDFEMCAYPPSGSQTSAQGGDSGGPMSFWENGEPILIGVLWGVAGLRQIGTRTAPYLQWIHDTTQIPLW